MTGILKKPIDEPDELMVALLAFGCPEEAQKEIHLLSSKYLSEQEEARVDALAEHYGVKLHGHMETYELLLLLARDFVVGFRKVDPNFRTKLGRRKGS